MGMASGWDLAVHFAHSRVVTKEILSGSERSAFQASATAARTSSTVANTRLAGQLLLRNAKRFSFGSGSGLQAGRLTSPSRPSKEAVPIASSGQPAPTACSRYAQGRENAVRDSRAHERARHRDAAPDRGIHAPHLAEPSTPDPPPRLQAINAHGASARRVIRFRSGASDPSRTGPTCWFEPPHEAHVPVQGQTEHCTTP